MKTRFTLFLLAMTSLLSAITPEEAFQKLMQGNQRYMQNQLIHPNRTEERRLEITSKQEPFAVIVGCSDSRVSPEIIFDQGIGDLFIIRIAGNVVGPIELASIDYAVRHLHAPLVVVLGHENCGAVKAVLAKETNDIQPIAVKIEEAIKDFSKNEEGTALENATKANVRAVVAQLNKSPDLAELLAKCRCGIIGGYYHLGSGKVDVCCTLDNTASKDTTK